MSTNSAIGILENGKIKAIYYHWDGHIESAGKTLQTHYDVAKTKKLVAGGDVSVLGSDIGAKQDFDSYDSNSNTCLFYGRDRGEDDVAAKTFKTKEAMVEWFDSAEFFYLLDAKTGAWSASRGKTWFNLKNALGRK